MAKLAGRWSRGFLGENFKWPSVNSYEFSFPLSLKRPRLRLVLKEPVYFQSNTIARVPVKTEYRHTLKRNLI